STGKLFCDCPSDLCDDHGTDFVRRLRPTQSEMGEIDRAALEEAERKLHFRYQSVPCACLVEADEEPPHDANRLAIEVSLEMSVLLDMTTVDEVHFMRKIVIDGSNTCGFQRTALIATNGHMMVGGKRIGILSLCLEEDAARKISEQGSEVTYRLDRLGIPLVEMATGPDMGSPEEVRLVAQRLGSLLRATKKVRRGIGTIREDVNVSISGGARVEIKGAQDLRLLPVYVEEEVKRQLALLDVKRVLRERGATKVEPEVVDLSDLLKGASCKVLASALRSGGGVFGVRMAKFADTLGKTDDGVRRLGAEMAAHARVAGVKGLFHSDELPAYGITADEVGAIRSSLDLDDEDAFVIVADRKERATAALLRAVDRANVGFEGVVEETRDPLPDGLSVYSRPLPGKDRMYPETDVRPILVDGVLMESIRLNLPELPEVKTKRFIDEYGLSRSQAEAVVNGAFEEEFELLASTFGNPQVVARVYLNIYPELEKAGLDPSSLGVEVMRRVLTLLAEGGFAKEAIPKLLSWLIENDSDDVPRAMDELSLGTVDDSEVRTVCERVVSERRDFILERREASLGPIMGIVMKELRGKADGKVISEILNERIGQLLS
ncbi:MAG: Glu-tRNA(Gln) amidotransferase subunit GatE, partial [Thermoplasmata archaeon]|nr:Glu-tRNA(Gln) amidotransferase subunit GatE [Thermoplasmata archaeon]